MSYRCRVLPEKLFSTTVIQLHVSRRCCCGSTRETQAQLCSSETNKLWTEKDLNSGPLSVDLPQKQRDTKVDDCWWTNRMSRESAAAAEHCC
ncbi:uncharacterized protein LOC121903449 isoform X2 [Thunnus maccoyii]|uniref:uncharacterized protein LOC121903449 isoform X2 n=1 Tax=Thunnus maccoyii TaxID=8240 RepID=UPI001C4ADAD3|nr:uncharacterized protein LOC121903449 isoform X2 [Thunnus maccoyii]